MCSVRRIHTFKLKKSFDTSKILKYFLGSCNMNK